MHNHAGWLFVLAVLVLSVLSAGLVSHETPSSSPWGEMITKHKWDDIPDTWISLGPPPNSTTIKLHIVLMANRENALIDALHEVSHPKHPKYGAHLSREQVAELVAPHPDTLEHVFSWLKYNGLPPSSISMTHGGGWLTIAGVPVAQANKILGASYELYYHAWSNDTILRTISYALPAALHMHVKTVAPTTAFTSMRLLQQTPLSHSSGELAPANVTSREPSDVISQVEGPIITPTFLRWLYKMPFDNPAPTDRNKLGIAGFANQFPDQDDLSTFMASFRSDVDRITASTRIVTVIPVNNGVNAQSLPGHLANIDTQYSVALTFPTLIEYYTIGGVRNIALDGSKGGDQYLEWLRYMIDMDNVPLTISVPYSTRELDLTMQYVNTVCDLFKALGARGVSILVASGDDGVGTTASVRNRRLQFSTSFPASCPYVTSVGGTTGFNPEIGSKLSGGGFSEFFERPDYQEDAISAYLPKLGSLYANLYNPLGRGVPDVALQSMDYAVRWNGRTEKISGTSFSTNTAAAIIALLNYFLVSNNRPPLGFLNYWLYEAGLYWDGLNDVIAGSNPGFSKKVDGFFATNGWDPVTGLGSLNYTLLERHLIKWS